jgi:D-glycero-alpha-D-manno-heptose-7-phosphate kinase
MNALRTRAPVRLDLAGGWTDVPPFSAREGGAVVNLAINRYCYVSASRREHGQGGIALYSADYDQHAEAATVAGLPVGGGLGLFTASLVVATDGRAQHGERPWFPAGRGLDLFVRCDAPPGSGTGSSAAVGVAVAGAIAAFLGEPLAAHEAARRAIAAERDVLRVPGGTQDQYAAAYGGANYMEFHGPVTAVSPLRLPERTIAELEKRLVLVYTGVSRVSGDIIANVMGAYAAGAARTVEALRTMRRLAGGAKAALLASDFDALGEVLAENWRSQKELHPSVSSAAIDDLYARALAAGASGGKALGAGGGGCLLFLAAADREHEVRRALAEAGAQVMDFSLEWTGLHVWDAQPAGATAWES